MRGLQTPRPSESTRVHPDAVGLISTLAIEDFTLPESFEATSKLLRSGTFLMASNMHPDLLWIAHGSIVDEKTGEPLWGASDVHTVEDM